MIAALFALLAPPPPLAYQWPAGQAQTYTVSVAWGEGDDQETTRERWELRVVEPASPGAAALLSWTRRLLALEVGGVRVPLESENSLTLTERRDARGRVTERQPYPNEPVAYGRLLRLLDVELPGLDLGVGGAWEFSVPEDDLMGALAWRYEVVARDAERVTVRGSAALQGAALQGADFAEATWELEPATGWVRRGTMRAKGLVMPGDEEGQPLPVTVRLEAVPPAKL